MLSLLHYDDCKEKSQSHEVSLASDYYSRWKGDLYYNIDPFDNIGYGETKDEAYEDFKEKFFAAFDELSVFAKLLEADVIKMV